VAIPSTATKAQRVTFGDVLAGVSVATVLIPQSLAYAQLAGLPPRLGLVASALPPIIAAPFASSRYLQIGPSALTSLLALGALAPLASERSPQFVWLAAVLAILVGLARMLIGALRLGRITYLMTAPVLMGFTSGAAILIMASQLPKVFGLDSVGDRGIFAGLWWTLATPGAWRLTALVLSVLTVVLMLGGRRLYTLFPGALLSVLGGTALASFGLYDGPVVGKIAGVFPHLPAVGDWGPVPLLIAPAAIIAVVGFAEVSSISRSFAEEDGTVWNPNQEFLSQGAANVVAGLSGGFPIGGSFSRSALNRLAGAQTRWSGGITGLTVLAFLPFAWLLDSLPWAVLGAAVVAGVVSLIRPRRLLALWYRDRVDAAVAWGTLAATLLLAPRVERAVVIGIVFAALAWLYRRHVER